MTAVKTALVIGGGIAGPVTALARCLRDLPDVAGAFAAYEGLRRERVEKVAWRASKTNNSKALGPVTIAMMPLAMRTFLNPEKTLGAEQRYRIDWQAPVTADASRAAGNRS
ncbi:hypothetical protein ACFV0L_04975 [Streptosporangium canum]|uniref:hypothetical protein n=1 Tax=Streptosporangium canum TaxID=324952 RepID=UPI0036CE6816